MVATTTDFAFGLGWAPHQLALLIEAVVLLFLNGPAHLAQFLHYLAVRAGIKKPRQERGFFIY
jgi:hypothetical protein